MCLSAHGESTHWIQVIWKCASMMTDENDIVALVRDSGHRAAYTHVRSTRAAQPHEHQRGIFTLSDQDKEWRLCTIAQPFCVLVRSIFRRISWRVLPCCRTTKIVSLGDARLWFYRAC